MCVTIHGDKWKLVDIEGAVAWAREREWVKLKWVKRAALSSKGRVSDYDGQGYEPESAKLVEGGWSHDHCEICWWTLSESDNPEKGEGYTTDGHRWLCTECYEHFIHIAE